MPNINRARIIITFFILFASSQACAQTDIAYSLVSSPGKIEDEGVFPYSFEAVWKAASELLKEGILVESGLSKAQEVSASIISDKESGFIAQNITIGAKEYFPIFQAHVFLIKPVDSQNTQVYYHGIRYDLCMEEAPFDSSKGMCWGCLVYSYLPGQKQAVLGKIENKLKGEIIEK